jgi:hypothetical protein
MIFKRIIISLIILLIILFNCKKKNPLAELLPEIPKFEKKDYKSCNQKEDQTGMAECLNGFAEKVIPLGINRQVQQHYIDEASCKKNQDGSEECSRSIGIHISDFQTEEGAFGYYTILRTPPVKNIDGIKSGEGYIYEQLEGEEVTGADIYFWKGKYTLQFVVDQGKDIEAISKLGVKIANSLKGQGKKPEHIKYLPERDRIENSFVYLISHFPNYEELKKIVQAEYTAANKKNYKIFISNMSTPQKAQNAFENWFKYSIQNMTNTKEVKAYSLNGFTYINGLGELNLVVVKKKYIFGIYGKGIVDTGQALADLSSVIKDI